jgi:hypothetical protein
MRISEDDAQEFSSIRTLKTRQMQTVRCFPQNLHVSPVSGHPICACPPDRWTRPDLIGSWRVGPPREAGETHQPSGSDLVRLVRGPSDGAEITVGIIRDRGPQTLKAKLDEANPGRRVVVRRGIRML